MGKKFWRGMLPWVVIALSIASIVFQAEFLMECVRRSYTTVVIYGAVALVNLVLAIVLAICFLRDEALKESAQGQEAADSISPAQADAVTGTQTLTGSNVKAQDQTESKSDVKAKKQLFPDTTGSSSRYGNIIHTYDKQVGCMVIAAGYFKPRKVLNVTPLSFWNEGIVKTEKIPVNFESCADGNRMKGYAMVRYQGYGDDAADVREEIVRFSIMFGAEDYLYHSENTEGGVDTSDHDKALEEHDGKLLAEFWDRNLDDFEKQSFYHMKLEIVRQGRDLGLSEKDFTFRWDKGEKRSKDIIKSLTNWCY